MVTVIIAWIVVGLAALAGFVLIQYARKNRKPKVVGYEPARTIKVPTNLPNPYAWKHEWAGSYRVTQYPRPVTTTPTPTYLSEDSFSTGLLTGIVAAELLSTDNTPSPSYAADPSPGFEGFGGGSTGGGGSDGSWTPDTSSSSYDSGSSSSYDSGSSSDSSSSSSDSSSW